jgi:hypothetical protein
VFVRREDAERFITEVKARTPGAAVHPVADEHDTHAILVVKPRPLPGT